MFPSLLYCDSCFACEKAFLTGKECALCRPPRQNNVYIYIHLDSHKGLERNIRQKENLNLVCFVSFKNQNGKMYRLLTAFCEP